MPDVEISLPEIVGRGYGRFWRFEGRYRVVKGSRASKKSKTAALWLIYSIMERPGANALVVRKVYRTIRESCFAELKWAISRLGVSGKWSIRESPLSMRYLPTGQQIYFRGLDDPQKIASITVEDGSLCWIWLEEAYEVSREEDFAMLDESLRGEVGEGLFKQVTLTFNPWNERSWLKKRFFDSESESVLAMTTDWTMNEWLDDADRAMFSEMERTNPRRYRVAGKGEWGASDGAVYENWQEKAFSVSEIKKVAGVKAVFGLDFGYTNDPSALFCGLVAKDEKTIWVFDEMYKKGMLNKDIYAHIAKLGYSKEKIRADSAEPKSIAELRELGLSRIRRARKGRDSVRHGIGAISAYRIIVHPRCVNFITEISNYCWEQDKSGKMLNVPIGDFNHLMDAMRYAMEEFSVGEAFSFA